MTPADWAQISAAARAWLRERLKAASKPEDATVDGRAEVVVQGAAADQTLVHELERLRSARLEEFRDKVQVGLAAAERGDVVDGPATMAGIRRNLETKSRHSPRG